MSSPVKPGGRENSRLPRTFVRTWLTKPLRITRRAVPARNALPHDVQDHARKAYSLFSADPRHPSLQFKKVHTTEPIYSARISGGYRAVGRLDGDLVLWFWIGGHDEYDRLLKSSK